MSFDEETKLIKHYIDCSKSHMTFWVNC